MAPNEQTRHHFPAWYLIIGGLILSAGYLPTLFAPFDFIDDGNLVYPAPAETSFGEHVGRWWDKVQANVEHLGPFRPTLWIHWELFANTFDGDPFTWRLMRLIWCGLAAAALLALMRELGLHPTAALAASAAAMWNPYRNEIWTSLTLSEGVAMPYALGALAAVRRATRSNRPWVWDCTAVACLAVVLGCKNTFVALVPAMLALRLWPDNTTLRDGWRQGRYAALAYLLPLAMPLLHFIYFKLNWQPGQYETPGPSIGQLLRFGSWMKGAIGLDFLAAGMVISLLAVLFGYRSQGIRSALAPYRAALLSGGLLFLAGVVVYLPLPMMAARYTMPAVWGVDVLFALLLTLLVGLPKSWPQKLAWLAVGLGLLAVAVAHWGRQERVAARSEMLWQVVHHLEQELPAGSGVAWVSGESSRGELNQEEGIHVAWHILHRGQNDIWVTLVDRDGGLIERVELPPPAGEPAYRLVPGNAEETAGWVEEANFRVPYRFGKKAYESRLERRIDSPDQGAGMLFIDPMTANIMRAGFENPNADWQHLMEIAEASRPPTLMEMLEKYKP